MFVSHIRNTDLGFSCAATEVIRKFFIKLRIFTLSLTLLFAMGGQNASAFSWFDPVDSCNTTGCDNRWSDPCPTPRECRKSDNRIAEQDNGYHNMLQGMRGPTEPTINNYESKAEDLAAATPAEYLTTNPQAMQYQGVYGGYRYGDAAITDFVPGAAPISPNPPTYPTNPQLDPGFQGAMSRYSPGPDINRDGEVDEDDKHRFMPPKNTPAASLVDVFPWLYMDTHMASQHILYRGTGSNTQAAVNNPMNLTPSYAGAELLTHSDRAPTNAEELSNIDNPANVDEFELNKSKCLKLSFREDKCEFASFGVDLLADTIGRWTEQQGYMSKSPALFARLNMDSCTNQIIIPMGLNPNYVFNDELRRHDAPYNENWCQPLRTRLVDCYRNRLAIGGRCLEDKGSRDGLLYDYRAWGYMRLAWKSVLRDAYTPSGGGGLYYGGQMGIGMPPYLTQATFNMAAGIPALTLSFPGVLQLVRDDPTATNPNNQSPTEIEGEEQYGDPFTPLFPGGSVGPIGALASYIGSYDGAMFTINDFARQRVERIWDPTHPYSPRWDFRGTDRLFSALARLSEPPVTGMGYTSSTSTCIVRCASVPVDILSFRLLAFSACMGCRIAMNAATFWSQVQYMMTDVSASFMGITGTCRAVSQDRAIENTLKNRVLGPLSGWLGDIPIPGVLHGRLSSNAGERARINVWGFSVNIPSSIAGGCHYYISPGAFKKTNAHNWDGTTFPGSAAVKHPPSFEGPQPKDYDSLWPTCNTKYEYKDQFLNVASCAMCTIISGDIDIFNGVRNCCDDVAHALAPLNTLKIRNTVFNPGLLPTPEGYTFKEYWSFRDDTRVYPYSPASDGSVLQVADVNDIDGDDDRDENIDYIGSHMPYMRWWDTGTTAGGASDWVGIADYNPDLDCGRYDTIVGVGTEDWEGDETKDFPDPATAPSYIPNPDDPLYVNDPVKNNAAKYCRYGGNGFAIDADTGVPLSAKAITDIASALGVTATGIASIEDFLGVPLSEIGVPPFYKCIRLRTIDIAHRKLGGDAMTSWLELKLYQTRAIQRGLNCLPQYEKFHKPFGTEEFTLNALGGSYNIPILLNRSAVDNTEALDPAKGPEKGYYRVPYRGAASANPPKLPNNDDLNAPHTSYPASGSSGEAYEIQNIAWPLAWRGYVSETDCKLAFPNFAGDGSTLGAGSFLGTDFTMTLPCGTTLTGGLVDGWTIPGMAESALGNILGPVGVPTYPELWPIMPAGLDRAKVGDIVYLTHEDMDYALTITYINQILEALSGSRTTTAFNGSLPYAAVVVSTRTSWIDNAGATRAPVDHVSDCLAIEQNCITKCEASVTLTEVNNGKFPDVCGNTDMYGHGQNRIIFKEWLPKKVMDAVFPPDTVVQDTCGHVYTTSAPENYALLREDTIGADGIEWGKFNTNYGSCADTKMLHCTYADIGLAGVINEDSVNLWNHFRVYRPLLDMRE